MSSQKILIRGLVASLILLALFSGSYLMRKSPEETVIVTPLDTATKETYRIILETTNMIKAQAKTDADILAEFKAGNYKLENPLIIVDPYKIAPLTALVLFKSATPSRLSIHVQGKSADVDVDYAIDSYETEHIIPIYGLYAGKTNTVILTLTDEQNNVSTKTLAIQTDTLMPELASNNLIATSTGLLMSPGFTFSYHNGLAMTNKTAFDRYGDYRWMLTKNFNTPCNFNQGKSLYVTLGSEVGNMVFLEINYLGKILNVYYSPYGNHHDIEVTPERLLVNGANNVPNTIEDFIYAIDRKTGAITKTLSYLTLLDRTRNTGVLYTNQDWMHMNSITEFEGDVIVSSNYQSSVIRNSWDGQIKWILADPIGYTTKYKPYLLKPIGSTFLYPYNQHAVEVLPDTDGNPDTLDIILFDNGTSRNYVNPELQRQIAAHEIVEPQLFSRMVQYQINEKDMTVRQVWSYGQDRPELFAASRGDADRLPNGNTLGVFFSDVTINSVHTQHATYVEVNAKNQVVWEVVATSSNEQNAYIENRAERFEIYRPETVDVKLGQTVNNLIPAELLQKALEYGQVTGS